MNTVSIYSSHLIDIIIDAREISYYELKKYFPNNANSNVKEVSRFNLENELDNLEQMGVVEQKEGMIIFQGI